MVKVVLGMMGSSPDGGSSSLSTVSQTSSFLSCALRHGVKELDTARAYVSGRSEEHIGQAPESRSFIISTKAPAFSPKSLAYDRIITKCAESLDALKLDKLDIYYLHGPDTDTPLTEQCDAINTLYQQGKFARFGVSNIPASDVRSMHEYCVRKGYVRPSVYQGGYNPLMRQSERDLFPTLRELGMVFYAYSPLGGGLFAKALDEILEPAKGDRFEVMKIFGAMYLSHPNAVDAMRDLTAVCRDEGLGVLEATVRWLQYHSVLEEEDAIILGASRVEQLERSLACKDRGPLSRKVLDAFEALWEKTREKTT